MVAAFPEGKPQCTSTSQVSTSVPFADILMVKRCHMAISRITVKGVRTRRHISLEAIDLTAYHTRPSFIESLLYIRLCAKYFAYVTPFNLLISWGGCWLLQYFTDMTLRLSKMEQHAKDSTTSK